MREPAIPRQCFTRAEPSRARVGSSARALLGALAIVLSAAPITQAFGSTGATLTPDRRTFLISKDIGEERWTIGLNLFSEDPRDVASVTGTIFRRDGGPASFVSCVVRTDSNAVLTAPESSFRLACSGAGACATSAEECARTGWTMIDDQLRIPASFFLPPGGLGDLPMADARSFGDQLIAAMSATLRRIGERARGWSLDATRAHAQSGSDRGATLTPDRLSHLVTKTLAGDRWSISFTFVPYEARIGERTSLVGNRFSSVTGTVVGADGAVPRFVYCTQNPYLHEALQDPPTEMTFSCQGADACEGSAATCAATSWRPIAADVRLPASFFLPPGGLPGWPHSDISVVVQSSLTDAPAVGSIFFSTEKGGDAIVHTADECPSKGSACFVPNLGECRDLEGVVVNPDSLPCACRVEHVPPECITCGDAASGQCGGECAYDVAGGTARGTCLPFRADSASCACFAIAADRSPELLGCGGPIGTTCSDDRCCVADPRSGCDPLDGKVSCPGICVEASACEADPAACASCRPPLAEPTPTPDAEPTPAPTAAPAPTPTCVPRGGNCSPAFSTCCEGYCTGFRGWWSCVPR